MRHEKQRLVRHNMYVCPPHLVTANNRIVRIKTQRNRLSIELLIETNKRVSIDNNNMYNKE